MFGFVQMQENQSCFLQSDHKGRQSQRSYKADQNRMLGCHDACQSPRTAVSDGVTVTAKQLEKIHLALMQLNAAMQKHEDYSISYTKTVRIVKSIKIWRTLVDASFLLAATARWFSPVAQTGRMVTSLRLECVLCVHWCEIKGCRTQIQHQKES